MKILKHLLIALRLEANDARAANQGSTKPILKHAFSGELIPTTLPETSPDIAALVPKITLSIVREAKTSKLHVDEGNNELSKKQEFRAASQRAPNPFHKHTFSGEMPPALLPEASPDMVGSVPKPAARIVREAKASRLQADDDNIATFGEAIVSKKGIAPNVVRKARKSGKVAADGNVEMDDSSVDLLLKILPSDASPVRKQNFSGQVAADGAIEMSHVITDSMPAPSSSYVRDAKKRHRQRIDANGVTSALKTFDHFDGGFREQEGDTDERDDEDENENSTNDADENEEKEQLSSKTGSRDGGATEMKGGVEFGNLAQSARRPGLVTRHTPFEGVVRDDGGSLVADLPETSEKHALLKNIVILLLKHDGHFGNVGWSWIAVLTAVCVCVLMLIMSCGVAREALWWSRSGRNFVQPVRL